MKHSANKALWGAFSFAALFLVAFVGFKSPDHHLSSVELARYNGQGLYCDLLFLNGKVTNTIPELLEVSKSKRALNATQLKAQAALKVFLISKISEKHPDFFVTFKNSIKSKNRFLIKNTLNMAVTYTSEAIAELNKNKMSSLNSADFSGACVHVAISTPEQSTGTIAFAVVDAGTLEAVALSNRIYSSSGASNKENSLLFDNVVNSIATNL